LYEGQDSELQEQVVAQQQTRGQKPQVQAQVLPLPAPARVAARLGAPARPEPAARAEQPADA
jgi:hypothetical protein